MAATGKKRVTFTLNAGDAREVFLCGTFNEWDPARPPLVRRATGEWHVKLLLPPGTYEYRYRVRRLLGGRPAGGAAGRQPVRRHELRSHGPVDSPVTTRRLVRELPGGSCPGRLPSLHREGLGEVRSLPEGAWCQGASG